jgi:hypothetical protein
MSRVRIFLFLLAGWSSQGVAAEISTALLEALERSPEVHALVFLSARSEPERLGATEQQLIDRNALSGRITYRWLFLPGFSAMLDHDAVARLSRDPGVAAIDIDLAGGANLVESRPLVGADSASTSGSAARESPSRFSTAASI